MRHREKEDIRSGPAGYEIARTGQIDERVTGITLSGLDTCYHYYYYTIGPVCTAVLEPPKTYDARFETHRMFSFVHGSQRTETSCHHEAYAMSHPSLPTDGA